MRSASLMTVCLLLLVPLLTFAADETVLDAFDYPDNAAAQAAWVPDENSPPAEVEVGEDGTCLQLSANFVENDRRIVYDRHGNWDFSVYGRFSLRIRVPEPAAFGHYTIYFHSGDGWYGHGFTVRGAAWETVTFTRGEFTSEGQPAGWDQVDTIRIAGWAGARVNAFMYVDDLIAYKDDVVTLIDPLAAAGGNESRAVTDASERVASQLREYGVFVGSVTEQELLAGELPDNPLIILPYNPTLSDEAAERLAEYIAKGGKVIAFYSLKPALAAALGIRSTEYVKREYDGQFAVIDLDETAAQGMPDAVKQASWNINTAEPVALNAKIIGRWLDSEGEDTGKPALLLSDTGAYMSHILLSDDPVLKRQMLLSLVGHFVPGVWETAAEGAVMLPPQVGHMSAEDFMYGDPPATAAGRKALSEAQELHAQANGALEDADALKAINLAAERDRKLQEAYLVGQVSRQGEFRAVWEHAGTGAYAAGWDKSMQVLADAGFNAIVPNQFWGGVALYQSKVLPVSATVAEKGDQVALAVEAGKKYGIEVHPWKVNFRCGRDTPKEFVDKMRAEGRLQKSFSGEEGEWLCPSHPDNRELEVASMVEVASNYDVAGVHFDYIRYPGGDNCFCEGCRQRFEAATGIRVQNWPADCRSEQLRDKWLAWRAEQITAVVHETEQRVHAVRPECKVSAAVFGNYPGSYTGVGQDWVTWAKEGYVDFLCPMDYTNSDYGFAGLVSRQLQQVEGSVPIYPGIGASSSSSTLSPDRVAGQIDITRNLGTSGFIVFNYNAALGDTVLPGLAKGITAEKTSIPHHHPEFRFEMPGDFHPTLRAYSPEPGSAIECTITSRPHPRGIEFSDVSGSVVLEDADGNVVEELGELKAGQRRVRVSFTAPEVGTYFVAVRGQATSPEGGKRPFTARSTPIVPLWLIDDIAVIMPAG